MIRITSLAAILSLIIVSCGSGGDRHISVDGSGSTKMASEQEVPDRTPAVKFVKAINERQFAQLIYDYKNEKEWNFIGEKPCVIDFYADWCKPCKIMAPGYERVAKEYKGKVDFYKLNVDQNREISAAFGIQSIPTIIFCPQNGNPEVYQGALQEADLKNFVENVVLK